MACGVDHIGDLFVEMSGRFCCQDLMAAQPGVEVLIFANMRQCMVMSMPKFSSYVLLTFLFFGFLLRNYFSYIYCIKKITFSATLFILIKLFSNCTQCNGHAFLRGFFRCTTS